MKIKPWVQTLLIVFTFMTILVASSECDDDILFVIKTIVCGLIIYFNGNILLKYGRI